MHFNSSWSFLLLLLVLFRGEHGSVVGSGPVLQAVSSIPDEATGFFNWLNPSNRITVLAQGSTQPLTEMSTRNLPGV
jgi:hypothetical protein